MKIPAIVLITVAALAAAGAAAAQGGGQGNPRRLAELRELDDAARSLQTLALQGRRHHDLEERRALAAVDALARRTGSWLADAEQTPRLARDLDRYQSVREAWRELKLRREDLDPGPRASAALDRVERAFVSLDSLAWRDRGPWRDRDRDRGRDHRDRVILAAGTPIRAVLAKGTCASAMPLNSDRDLRMYLAGDLRLANGETLPKGAPLGVAALGNARAGDVRLQLRGLRHQDHWYEVATGAVPLRLGGQRPRGDVCVAAGQAFEFVLTEPVRASNAELASYR